MDKNLNIVINHITQRAALNKLLTTDGRIVNCSFKELEWKEVNNLDPDQDIRYYNLIDFDNKIEKDINQSFLR